MNRRRCLTGCRRGQKQKLWAAYRVQSLKWTSHVAMRFHCRVWCRALSLCDACIRRSGTASIGELAHREKSRTQSINQSITQLI